MPCANDWPGGLCSGHGYCDAATDTCVCDSGYDGRGDLIWRPSAAVNDAGVVVDSRTGDALTANTNAGVWTDCGLNHSALTTLHAVNAAVAIVCVIVNLIRLIRRVRTIQAADAYSITYDAKAAGTGTGAGAGASAGAGANAFTTIATVSSPKDNTSTAPTSPPASSAGAVVVPVSPPAVAPGRARTYTAPQAQVTTVMGSRAQGACERLTNILMSWPSRYDVAISMATSVKVAWSLCWIFADGVVGHSSALGTVLYWLYSCAAATALWDIVRQYVYVFNVTSNLSAALRANADRVLRTQVPRSKVLYAVSMVCMCGPLFYLIVPDDPLRGDGTLQLALAITTLLGFMVAGALTSRVRDVFLDGMISALQKELANSASAEQIKASLTGVMSTAQGRVAANLLPLTYLMFACWPYMIVRSSYLFVATQIPMSIAGSIGSLTFGKRLTVGSIAPANNNAAADDRKADRADRQPNGGTVTPAVGGVSATMMTGFGGSPPPSAGGSGHVSPPPLMHGASMGASGFNRSGVGFGLAVTVPGLMRAQSTAANGNGNGNGNGGTTSPPLFHHTTASPGPSSPSPPVPHALNTHHLPLGPSLTTSSPHGASSAGAGAGVSGPSSSAVRPSSGTSSPASRTGARSSAGGALHLSSAAAAASALDTTASIVTVTIGAGAGVGGVAGAGGLVNGLSSADATPLTRSAVGPTLMLASSTPAHPLLPAGASNSGLASPSASAAAVGGSGGSGANTPVRKYTGDRPPLPSGIATRTKTLG